MKPNIIYTTEYDIRLFTWEGHHGVAEISDLNRNPPFCRVYNDSIDEGFAVVGRTGKIIVFAIDNINYRENEIISWELKSISEPGFDIILFND